MTVASVHEDFLSARATHTPGETCSYDLLLAFCGLSVVEFRKPKSSRAAVVGHQRTAHSLWLAMESCDWCVWCNLLPPLMQQNG